MADPFYSVAANNQPVKPYISVSHLLPRLMKWDSVSGQADERNPRYAACLHREFYRSFLSDLQARRTKTELIGWARSAKVGSFSVTKPDEQRQKQIRLDQVG